MHQKAVLPLTAASSVKGDGLINRLSLTMVKFLKDQCLKSRVACGATNIVALGDLLFFGFANGTHLEGERLS